ncbi:MAG: PA2779 family protein [Thioalkalivibrionaceae bacterium]
MRWLTLSVAAVWGLALLTAGAQDATANEHPPQAPALTFESADPAFSSQARVSTAELLGQTTDSAFDAAAARERLLTTLVEHGVSPSLAEARLDRLTLAELQDLDRHFDDLPAGAGALAAVAVVFLVFVITDALGITNIFSFVR